MTGSRLRSSRSRFTSSASFELNNALTVSATLSGNAANLMAAQVTFAGRTYLAINQAAPGFQDATELLLDIAGATGTIDAGEFIT